MGKKIKFILIILIGILVVGALATSIFVNFRMFALKKTVEQERNKLRQENETLSTKISQISQENKQLQDRISLLNTDLDKVAKEKDELQKNFELANKSKDQLVEQLRVVNAKLSKEDDEKQKIQETLSSLKRKNTLLIQQLKSLVTRKNLLEKRQPEANVEEKKAQEIKKQIEEGAVELPTIVVYSKPETYRHTPAEITAQTQTSTSAKEDTQIQISPPITLAIESKILGVNRENNFVVIDKGEDSGVKLGDIFQVYRKGKSVATIEVIQTRKSVAACDIKKESKPIEVGDTVR